MIRVSSLTESEIASLRQLTQQAIGRVAERAWFVLLSNNGKTVSQICILFQRGPNCVRKWIKRYQAYGICGLYDIPRTGRPKSLSGSIRTQIDCELQKTPQEHGFLAGFWTLPLLLIHIMNLFSLRLSLPTVRNLLYELGYRCRRPRLAASKVDEFAKEKLAAIGEVFANWRDDWVILYQDETTFRLLPLSRRRWMKIGEQVRIITPTSWNRRESIFGALNGKTGKFTTAFFDKANSESFTAFLEQLLVEYPTQLIYLVFDNASYHKSQLVRYWLLSHQRIQFLWLPKNNPQLNPIEKIWWQMKSVVAANRPYKGIKELKQSCLDFLMKFTQEDAIRLAKLAA